MRSLWGNELQVPKIGKLDLNTIHYLAIDRITQYIVLGKNMLGFSEYLLFEQAPEE
ncbi:MAG: hypothetical protein WD491_04525 [Balneolales bacterium]